VRKIRMTFLATGESVVADLLDHEAPQTCDYIWSLLPMESKPIHGQFSGSEIFVLIEGGQSMPRENLTQLPLPGEVLYFHETGGSVTGNRVVGEVCFAYGRGVVLRGAEGVPTHCALFARIPGDWKTDWVDFAQACRRVRWEGPSPLRIEKIE
jgi:hypothetical protein